MKVQKTQGALDKRMQDYRAAELEKTKALLDYVAIMADVELPQDEQTSEGMMEESDEQERTES